MKLLNMKEEKKPKQCFARISKNKLPSKELRVRKVYKTSLKKS